MRGTLLSILVLPVAITLALAAPQELRRGSGVETPCWIFPNLRTLAAPGGFGCPITVRDAIRGVAIDGIETSIADLGSMRELPAGAGRRVEALVERDGQRLRIRLPAFVTTSVERRARWLSAAIAALLVLAIPLALVRSSSAAAAVPLALFYSAFSVAIVSSVSGRSSTPASLAGLASLAFAPAPLFHLAFLFPRETRVAREAPAVLRLPYLASVFLLGLCLLAVWRTPALWPAFLQLLAAVAATAWMVLLCACAFAVRESQSAIERTRAKLVLLGPLLLPVVPTAFGALRSSADGGEVAALYLWSGAATMPLSIALGISRYNLFNLGPDARQGVARALYVVVATVALAAAARAASWAFGEDGSLPASRSLLAVCLLCVLALEPLRSRMPGLFEGWLLSRLRALRATRLRLERRLSGLDDEDEILGCVQEAMVEGAACTSGAVFLADGRTARLAHAFGADPPSRRRLADAARHALGSGKLLHLAGVPDPSRDEALLLRGGVTLVASIDGGGEELGILLLRACVSRRFYTGIEVDFVRAVVAVAGSALFRARANARRRVREREAAAGRLALALAQDTGKDIGWLRMLSARLAEDAGGSLRARRDAAMIADLCEELVSRFDRILEQTSSASGREHELPRFDDILERAARRVAGRHGKGRIVENVDPSLREVRAPDPIGRVLGNLLDNALRATGEHESVHLFATLDGEWIRVSIEDRGCGIPLELEDRVFEPGVSSRGASGGAGIGLTVAREILETVGGTVRLDRRRGGGTVATIRMPRCCGGGARSA